MSRTVNASLQTKLNTGTTNLCHLTRITTKAGLVKRFTDHSADVVFSGNTYSSDGSVVVSAVTSSANNGIQSTNLNVVFTDTGVALVDVARGLYDNATVEVSVIDYDNPAWGELLLMKGVLSVFNTTDRGIGQFEVRGLLTRGETRVGQYYSAECRADLGDSRCGVTLASFQDTGTVEEVEKATSILVTLDSGAADGFYSLGVITFTSGDNNGYSMEVMSQAAYDASWDRIFLALALPYDVAVGDTFTITAGCDKRTTTCRTKFSNLVNFRGEPFVPGSDSIIDTNI